MVTPPTGLRAMKGKWARGIEPRNFTWIIKDSLAICERPGGYSRNHRRVRRQEEVIWLREEGFTRIVSILGSPHNLQAYDEMQVRYAHFPYPDNADPRVCLAPMYDQVAQWITAGEKIVVHAEDVSDRFMGVMAGYLLHNKLLEGTPQAISILERIIGRQMGPEGREVVVAVNGSS